MLFLCHRIFEQHNNITMCDYIISLNKFNNIVLSTHNTLTCSRNISDSGEVTSGPTRHLPGPGIRVGGTKTHLGDTVMRHLTARGSVPVFRTSSQRGPFKYLEKVCIEIHVTQERWGRSHLWKQRCGNIRIHLHHIHSTQCVPPAGVTQYDFVQERQLVEGWE